MKDNIIPKEKWEFDSNVAECFENMLERSIPQYETMRNTTLDMASIKIDSILNKCLNNNIKKSTIFNILDIGCSDGIQIEKFINKYGNIGKYKGIDISEPMLNKARKKFQEQIYNNNVSIENIDLRYSFPTEHFDVITSILSIQFTPIEYRQEILYNIHNSLNENGIFLMVEKVLGETSKINNMMVKNYYDMKKIHGYSQEQIDRKKQSLEGVLVPCTNNWNIELLKQAGFRQVDVYWRWMNFVGYIAIK